MATRWFWRLRWSPNHPVLSHPLRILAELRSIRRREGDGAHSEWSARLDNVWLVRWLQRLDARRFPVIHDEGAAVQLRDAGVKLAQEFEHAGLVGFLFLFVEPAGLVVRVELVIGIEQLANLPIQRSHGWVLMDQWQGTGLNAGFLFAGPDRAIFAKI